MKLKSKARPSGAPLAFAEGSRSCKCEFCCNDVAAVEFAFSVTTGDGPDGAVRAGADFVVEGTVLVEFIGDDADVRIPDGITEIAPQDFCEVEIESVILPPSLEKIGWLAFEGCVNLEGIDIPYGVAVLPEGVFKGCTSLERVQLPTSLRTIEDWAFENCCSLEGVVIPEGVWSIGYGAFSGCGSLETVSLPSTITYLGSIDGAFDNCSILETLNCCIDCGEEAEPGSDTCEDCS